MHARNNDCACFGCRRCSVVTSAFHMPRSRAIFETCFALAGATLWDDPDHFRLDFHAVHDEGLFSDDVLEARCLKEQVSLEVCCSQAAPSHDCWYLSRADITTLRVHATCIMGWAPVVLQAWQRDTAAFSTLSELHKWMHATHLCYAVARQVRSLHGCYGVKCAMRIGISLTVYANACTGRLW